VTLPPGYRSRAATRDDLDVLVALFQAADLADVGFTDPARDEILETWAQPWFDLESDSLVVEAPDGTIAAYSETIAKDATASVFVFAKIHPSHRRRGIGSLVAAATEARAAEMIPTGVTAPLRNGFPSSDEQAAALVAWLDAAPATTAQVVVGDFNADPSEPAYARMGGAGFRSAFAEANGAEPAVTWPSGLQAPAMDTDGDPSCLDYVWLRGSARALEARLWADRPAVEDPTLYPSDHVGIVATIEVG